MARSLDLLNLLNQAESARDQDWERALFQSLIESCVTVERGEPQAGPDGWPYLFVTADSRSTEPFIRILDWLHNRGVGLVVNANKPTPDYIFTYGMIWNYRERGQFLTPLSTEVPTGQVKFEKGQGVLAGPPSQQYLPDYVKSILREFLQDQGVVDPKILVMSRDQKHFDLCFSLESMGNPNPSEHRGIAEAISWFLPAHYSLMLISEQGLPQFHSL